MTSAYGYNARSSKGGGGGAVSKPKKRGLFGNIVHGLEDVVVQAPRGLLNFGVQAGEQVLHNPLQILGPTNLPGVAGALGLPVPHLGPLFNVQRHQGEGIDDYLTRVYPAGAGTLHGFEHTGDELRHPTHAARNYSQQPVQSFLNDLLSVSIAAGAAGSGLRGAAKVAGAETPTGQALTGLSKVDRIAGPAGRAANAPIEAPSAALRLAGKGFDRAATSEGNVGNALRALHLDPDARSMKPILARGRIGEDAATTRQIRLARKLDRIVKDPVERQVVQLIGEHEAPALATHRAAAGPGAFDQFVADRYKGSVTPEAAHLAADVVDGVAPPEVAQRVQEALEAGRTGKGGRLERQAAFLEAKGPGAERQLGYQPDPVAVQEAFDRQAKNLPRAERIARSARSKSEQAAERLGDVRDDQSALVDQAAGEAAAVRQARPASGSLDRLGPSQAFIKAGERIGQAEAKTRSVGDFLRAAKEQAGRVHEQLAAKEAGARDIAQKAGNKAELDAALAKADRAEADLAATPTELPSKAQYQSALENVRSYRKSTANAVRHQADDLEASIDVGYRPARPRKGSAGEDYYASITRYGAGAARAHGTVDVINYLEDVNRQAGIVPEIRGGTDYDAIAEHVGKTRAEVKRLRSEARAIEQGRGNLRHAEGDPDAELYLRGKSSEAAAALAASQPTPGLVDRVWGEVDAALQADKAATQRGEPAAARAGLSPEGKALYDSVTVADRIGADVVNVPVGEARGQVADVRNARTMARSDLAGAQRLTVRELEQARRRLAAAKLGGQKALGAERLRFARLEGRAAVADERAAGRAGIRAAKVEGRAAVRVTKAEMQARQAERVSERANAVTGQIRGRAQKAAAETARSVEAAPARLKPVLSTNRAVTADLEGKARELRAAGDQQSARLLQDTARSIPQELGELERLGIDADHWIHRPEEVRGVGRSARVPGSQIPAQRKVSEDRLRKGSPVYARDFRHQALAEIDVAHKHIAVKTWAEIEKQPFAVKLGQKDTALEHIDPPSVRGDGEAARAASDRIKTEADKAGYIARDPTNPFGRPSIVTKDTVFIPKALDRAFEQSFTNGRAEQFLHATVDPVHRVWKAFVLPLRPAWNVGNLVGNTLLATIGAGVDPITLAVEAKRAVSAYRKSGPRGDRTFADLVPDRLLHSGPTHAELEYQRGTDELSGGPLRRGFAKVQRVVESPYALNEFVDNIGRSAVYLAKLRKGMSEEQALGAALKAMGDFSNLSPVERTYVRRAIPFYAWQRHITKLAFSLPIEHPLRVAWTLHLGDQFQPGDEDLKHLPFWMKGAIPIGSKLLDTSALNPFGDAGRVLSPQETARSLSPLLKLPIEAGTGINLDRGVKPFTRPPGTGKVDASGNPLPTAPSIAHLLGGLIPQKKVLEDLRGRNDVARYDTGDPVTSKGQTIPSPKNRAETALRYLGIPLSDRAAAVERGTGIEEKAAANQTKAAKARGDIPSSSGGSKPRKAPKARVVKPRKVKAPRVKVSKIRIPKARTGAKGRARSTSRRRHAGSVPAVRLPRATAARPRR